MKCAIVDLETTTADPTTAAIVEIAACLYDVDHRTVLSVRSTLVRTAENHARDINHIPDAVLADAPELVLALDFIGRVVAKADVIVAHFGDTFDRPVLEAHGCTWAGNKPWLDTNDIAWPMASPSRSLLGLAHAHGVQIGTLHRAADDVLLVARLFERIARDGHDVGALIAKAMRPKKKYRAEVSYDTNALAKSAGFRWIPEDRMWCKTIAPEDVPTLGLPFRIVEVSA